MKKKRNFPNMGVEAVLRVTEEALALAAEVLGAQNFK